MRDFDFHNNILVCKMEMEKSGQFNTSLLACMPSIGRQLFTKYIAAICVISDDNHRNLKVNIGAI